MLEAWRAEGVGEELVRRVPERTTGLYAIRTDPSGERHFSYWREQSAARVYLEGTPAPLELHAESIELLYLSGVTLAVMASALGGRLPALLHRIRRAGGRIAFDNNYRARLWPSPQAARAAFEMLYRHADIALVTLDDEAAIDPSLDGAAQLARVLALGCREVVVKRGEHSTLVREAGRAPVEMPVQPVRESLIPPGPAIRSPPATCGDGSRRYGRGGGCARQPARGHRHRASRRHRPACRDGGSARRRVNRHGALKSAATAPERPREPAYVSQTRSLPMAPIPQPDAEFLMRDTTSHPPAYAPGYKTSVLRSPRQR